MSSSFRSILHLVTQEKLEELKIQKDLTSNHFNPVLTKIAEPSTTPIAALQIIYKAINDYPLKDIVDSSSLENINYVLENAKDDPSISSQLLLTWVDKVKQEIQFSLRKCEYSYLYGSLLSEWLEIEERKRSQSSGATEVAHFQDPNSTEEAALNRKVAVDKLKELMFTQPQSDEFDPEKFRKFLSDDLFKFEGNVEGEEVIKAIQKETKDYFNVDNYTISSYDVQSCIKGLRSQDLLSLEKKTTLKELSENSEALGEVASVLTNRLKHLKRFEWPASTETIELRRGITGEYKTFINEDVITALFLQYVGVTWAAFFKKQFLKLYQSKAWIKASYSSQSIEEERNKAHEKTFLSSLPDSMSSQESKLQDEYVKIEASDVVHIYSDSSSMRASAAAEPVDDDEVYPEVVGAKYSAIGASGVGASGVGASGGQFPGAGAYPTVSIGAGAYPTGAAGGQFPGAGSQFPGIGRYPEGSFGSGGQPGIGGYHEPVGPGFVTVYPGGQYPGIGDGFHPSSFPANKYQYEIKHNRKPINTSSKIDFKQTFLHTLSTEIRLNQVIHSDKPFVIVQADLESFGPSLIHGAALTALEYFGVPERWLEFFKKFLQPKANFAKGEELKTIVRGVPTSHSLSSLFGETLLFLLDFLINQKCNGMRIYRIADEFWFWSDATENVTEAWEIMLTYGKMVGLKVNENRSGSVSVYSDEMLSKVNKTAESTICGPAPLPQKNIHWGYLELHSNGTIVIDQKAIPKFLQEMQGLLDKSECVLEWINVFNKYLAFFIRNFGKSALVSGKQHLDQIISSLRVIYTGLFGSEDGNPVEKLKAQFDKLKSTDIVDVWVYWPLERGGLGLINPFIGIISLRETYVDLNDEDNFTKLPLEDKVFYDELKEEHEKRKELEKMPNAYQSGYQPVYPVYPVYSSRISTSSPIELPTWAEYLGKRETKLRHWYFRYLRMLERPGPRAPNVSERFWKLDTPIHEEHDKNYMMALLKYYEIQLVLHFGSVKFINTKLLPMSMIANIQKTKVQY